MIPFPSVREADRRRIEIQILAQPSPARLVRSSGAVTVFNVLASEYARSREARLAGFDPLVDLTALVALPLGASAPTPEKDVLEVVDLAGQHKAYTITRVSVLRGLDCYRLDLRVRRNAPTLTKPLPPR